MVSSLLTSSGSFSSQTYTQVCSEASCCTRCSLHATRTKAVFGQGVAPCSIMCIGEAPGADEDAQGVPFVGRAGQVLTMMLSSIGLSRPNDVNISNTIKSRPPGNRTPLPAEIEACYPFLLRQIFEVKPKILILLGSPAMKTILNPTESISKMRGRWVDLPTDYQEAPIKVITLFHPSFLLRNPSKETGSPKWHTWNDLQAIRSELNNS